jgi:hypothetical protein
LAAESGHRPCPQAIQKRPKTDTAARVAARERERLVRFAATAALVRAPGERDGRRCKFEWPMLKLPS